MRYLEAADIVEVFNEQHFVNDNFVLSKCYHWSRSPYNLDPLSIAAAVISFGDYRESITLSEIQEACAVLFLGSSLIEMEYSSNISVQELKEVYDEWNYNPESYTLDRSDYVDFF